MDTFHQQELFTSEHRNNWFYKQIKQACPDKVCFDDKEKNFVFYSI